MLINENKNTNPIMFKAMTIAGSDTSGGAGMEADLKTFQEYGVYGMVALTCIVAQDPARAWFHDITPVATDVIEKQLRTILDGIGIDAMKTGMLGSAELVELVAHTIDKYSLKNVVIDPVMVCKGIDDIMVPEAAAAIKELLLKRADITTPNTIEAAFLADMPKLTTLDDMKQAAAKIVDRGAKCVIIKAGDRLNGEVATDIAYDGHEYHLIQNKKIPNAFNHGAGCTYSASVTANLAKGKTLAEALEATNRYMQAALRGSFRLNQFSGATRHCAWREE